jgi:hypothetical protein
MHVRGYWVTTASTIAELPARIADGAPLRVFVAPGSPCVSLYVPAFPATSAGPPPFVPAELSGDELWHAADALRRVVEDDPAALHGIREALDPVEADLWAEASAVLDQPARWATVGASWGTRALHALQACIP